MNPDVINFFILFISSVNKKSNVRTDNLETYFSTIIVIFSLFILSKIYRFLANNC